MPNNPITAQVRMREDSEVQSGIGSEQPPVSDYYFKRLFVIHTLSIGSYPLIRKHVYL
jgi:hypothetical protein